MTWDPGSGLASPSGGTGVWDSGTSADWSNGSSDVVWPNTNVDVANFAGTAGTVTVASTITLNQMNFLTNGYLLTGGTFMFGGTSPTITLGTGLSETIASNISDPVGSPIPTISGASGSSLTLSGEVGGSFNGGDILTVSGSGTVTLSGSVDNSYLAAIVNSGTLVLAKTSTSSSSGAHALGDPVTINGGTLQMAGTGTGQFYQNVNVTMNGGVFDLDGQSEGFNILSGSSGAVITNSAASTTGTLTIGQNNGSGTFAGIIQNGSGVMAITKAGTGTETLTGANTYTGTTAVTTGTLQLSGAGTIGGAASTLTISSGAVLDLYGTNQTIGAFSGASAGQVQNNSGSGTSVLTISGATPGTFAGVITDNNGTNTGGTVGLAVNSTGSLTLSSSNSFSGGLRVNSGTAILSNAYAAGSAAITLGASTGASAALQATAITISNAINLGSGSVGTLTVGNNGGSASTFSGAIGLNGNALTIASASTGSTAITGGITGTGNLTLAPSSTATSTLGSLTVSTSSINITGTVTNAGTVATGNLNSTSNTTTFAGTAITTPIGSNVTGLVQNGPSVLLLDANSSAFTGGINIKSGAIYFNSNSNDLGASTNAVTLSATSGNTASLIYSGRLGNASGANGSIANPISVAATATVRGGSSQFVSFIFAHFTAGPSDKI